MKIRSSLCNRVVGDSLTGLVCGSLDHLNVEEAANSLLNPSLSDVDLVSAFSVVDPFPFLWASVMSDEQGFESAPSVRSASSQSLSEQSLSSVGDSTNSAPSPKPTLVHDLNADGIAASPVNSDSVNPEADSKLPVSPGTGSSISVKDGVNSVKLDADTNLTVEPAEVVCDCVEDPVKLGGPVEAVPELTPVPSVRSPEVRTGGVHDSVKSGVDEVSFRTTQYLFGDKLSPSKTPTNTEGRDAVIQPSGDAVVAETVGSPVLKAVCSSAERSGAEAVSIHFHFFLPSCRSFLNLRRRTMGF